MYEVRPSVDYSLSQRTLALVLCDNRLLLGERVPEKGKEKVGQCLLNGPGGKLELAVPGRPPLWHGRYAETPETCVCRETKAEAGISLMPEYLQKYAVLSFYWPASKDNQLVHVFLATGYNGKTNDTDEMINWYWHPIDQLPWKRMFKADKHWLPYVLDGTNMEAFFTYDEDMNVRKYEIWSTATGKRLESK